MLKKYYTLVERTRHEGEGDSGTGTGAGGFTQEQVNQMVAEERRRSEEKWKETHNNLTTEIEALKQRSNLTKKDRDELEARIKEYKQKVLTQEELAQQDKDRLERTRKEEVEALSSELDSWKKRFSSTMIENALITAANKYEAVNPNQITKLLISDAHLVEDLDEDNKPKGSFTPHVKYTGKNDKGETVVLDVPVEKAVELMTKDQQFFNLFKSTMKSGAGGSGSSGKGGTDLAELAKTDPKAYIERRKAERIKQ